MSNDKIEPKDEKEVRLAKAKLEMGEVLGAVADLQKTHEDEAARLLEVKARRRRQRRP